MSRKVSGFKAWVVQRVSAIYLGIYFLYVLQHFILVPPATHHDLVMWFASPMVVITMALFFLLLLLHAWIGVRDVIIDYIHHLGIRLVVLALIAILLVGCGFSVFRSLILVAT